MFFVIQKEPLKRMVRFIDFLEFFLRILKQTRVMQKLIGVPFLD